MLGILCDGLASRPGGVVILLVTLYSVSCDGLTSRPRRTVILLVNLYWVSRDALASNPWGGGVVMLLVPAHAHSQITVNHETLFGWLFLFKALLAQTNFFRFLFLAMAIYEQKVRQHIKMSLNFHRFITQ